MNRSEVNEDYKKYVILIFLKLYSQQLLKYHQSFEVRESPFFWERFKNKSALAKAFCEILGDNFFERKLGPEFLPAYKAVEYLDKHYELKNDAYIQEQLKLIDSLQVKD